MKSLQSRLFYNHHTQRVFSLGAPAVIDGKVFGYYVKGVARRHSAIYTLDVICDVLEYGFACAGPLLTLEVIN